MLSTLAPSVLRSCGKSGKAHTILKPVYTQRHLHLYRSHAPLSYKTNSVIHVNTVPNLNCHLHTLQPQKPSPLSSPQRPRPTHQQQPQSPANQNNNNNIKMSSSSAAPQTTNLKSSDLLSLVANRRSYYNLTSSSPIPDTQIQQILEQTLHKVPSAFNSQTTRLILALGPHHEKIWSTTASVLRKHMGEERWAQAPTGKKLDGFAKAHGTVLFYEDTKTVATFKEKFAGYAQHFDAWSEQTSGMHQITVWVALEAEGFGANLQHYNPVIDDELAQIFGVPEGWKLRAQLVFGAIEGGRPDEKEKKKFEETLKVFGPDAKI